MVLGGSLNTLGQDEVDFVCLKLNFEKIELDLLTDIPFWKI